MLRPATEEDRGAIAGIQRASREASSWDSLEYPCVVAQENGKIVGFLVTRQIAPGESEILNLAVDAGYRRRGIAGRLVREAIARAPGTWFLEVRESNMAAIGFYESLGFEACGRRQNYYNDPTEAAIVMRFHS